MKAKFKLGFLSGFMNVPNAWPGQRHIVPLLEPSMTMAGDLEPAPGIANYVKHLIFECRNIDEDRAAIFEFLEVR